MTIWYSNLFRGNMGLQVLQHADGLHFLGAEDGCHERVKFLFAKLPYVLVVESSLKLDFL